MFATLKAICTAVKILLTRMRHCAATEIAASRMACTGDSCTMASRMNGKFNDMEPSPRGSATFKPELSRMAKSRRKKAFQCVAPSWAARAVAPAAARSVAAIWNFMRNGIVSPVWPVAGTLSWNLLAR